MRTITPLAWNPEPTDEQCEAETLHYIPAISDETIAGLLARITPLVRRAGALCKFVPSEPWDPKTRCFTWSVKDGDTQPVASNEFRLLDAVVTYHHCQHPGLIQPRVFEVLAQIPDGLLPKVVAFEVLVEDGVVEVVDYPGLLGHKTVTLLYGNAINA